MEGHDNPIPESRGQKRRLRRHWSLTEKVTVVHKSYAPQTSVSAVARAHGIAASQLFEWRKLAREGVLTTEELRDAGVSP